MISRLTGGDTQIARCVAGSFLLRAAAAGAVSLISFYLAELETSQPGVRGSLIIGLATTLFFTAEIIGAIGFGALIDRHGERRYVRLGPIFGGIGALALATASSVFSVLFAKVLQGLSTAAVIPASLAVLSRRSGDDDQRRGRIMSLFEIFTLGGLAAGLIAAGDVWDRFGVAAFWLMLVLYAVSLVVLWPVGSTAALGSGAGSARHGFQMSFLRSGRAFRLVPAWIAVNGVLGIWLSHAAFQLKRPDDPTQLLVGGYSASEVSRFSAATLALFVVGIGVWGFVMGRYGSLRVMSGSLVGLVALCPALFLLNHATVGNQYEIGGWLLASAASLFIASGFTPAALAYLSRIAEEHASERGAIMGVYSVLLGVGQAMGGAIGAIAAEWRGADGMIGLSAVFAAAAVVAVGALARLDRAAGERQTPQRVDELASLR